MRKSKLLSATALSIVIASALSLAMLSNASAQTTVSTNITTPLVTSTTGNLTLSATQTLATGTAITVNSNNNVTISGKVDMASSADGSKAIFINAGRTSNISITGNITVTDNYTATDTFPTTRDGVIDGPFATGTGRYGLHSLGASPLIGNIDLSSTSSVTIDGNNSYAIRLENLLQGNLNKLGAMTLTGDNSVAIALEKGVTGNVRIGGNISVLGTASQAVKIGDTVTGSLIFDGTISGTGYSSTQAVPVAIFNAFDPVKNLSKNGVLIDINSNVIGGILFNTPAIRSSTTSTTDADGDGIADTTGGNSVIAQFGDQAALRIASATQDILINKVIQGASTTADNRWAIDYGLVMRGSISASGVYKGVSSNAVQIGGLGRNVTIENGILAKGAINSSSLDADTIAIWLKSNSIVPTLEVAGVVTSTVTTDASAFTNTSYGLDIASGASLTNLTLAAGSTLRSIANGASANATAIRDRSNSLANITSKGVISSVVLGTDFNSDGIADTPLNAGVAIDLRTNTIATNLTLTDVSTTTTSAPSIIGNVLLGSGNDVVRFNGGLMLGDIDFGAGANSLILSKGAATTSQNSIISGKFTGIGTVAIDLLNGTMNMNVGSRLNTTTLHVGSTSKIFVVLDTLNPTIPVLSGSGAASFDNGAAVKLGLNHIIQTPTKFTVLTASSISLGNINTNLTGDVPYIYTATLSTNVALTELYADFRLKTSTELGISSNDYSALGAVLVALASDNSGTNAVLTKSSKADFIRLFNQYLPDNSGETFLTLAKSHESLNHVLSIQTRIPDDGDIQIWAQEYGFSVERKNKESIGFKSTGFNFAAGSERGVSSNQAVGVYIGVTGGSPVDNFSLGKEKLSVSDISIGGYWRLYDGPVKTWLQGGLGYSQFESTRNVLDTFVNHVSTSKWNGTSFSGSAGASYRFDAGWVSLTPAIMADYYALSEAAHKETGGGTSFDLNIAKRDSHVLSTRALVNISPSNQKASFKPELWLGYQNNISMTMGDTKAHFTGGNVFTLKGLLKQGGGPIAGFRVSTDNEYSHFAIEGGYEKQDSYENVTISLRTRFRF